ncbi:MAG: hypothetical protein RL071_1360 [Pseudomonadota bacterium]|jgi:hypothetical protein
MSTSPRRRPAALPLLAPLALLTACRPPPDAPEKLEDLCGYLYDHIGDEDDEALAVGLTNLRAWLDKGDNFAATVEGYSITQLDQDTVDKLDDRPRDTSDLLGAASIYDHGHKQRPLIDAIVVKNQMEVFTDNYLEYERTFDQSPKCFPDRDCLELAGLSITKSSFVGAEIVTKNRQQFRWIETDDGWAVVRRNWLVSPAETSVFGTDIVLEAQYYLGVVLPYGGRTSHLIATWMEADYGAIPATDDFIKSQIVKSMQEQGEQLEAYLDEN